MIVVWIVLAVAVFTLLVEREARRRGAIPMAIARRTGCSR